MCVYHPNESIGQRLATFRQSKVKAILNIEAILFEQIVDSASPTGVRIELRLDAQNRWEEFLSINQTEINLSDVAAIYIVDEPVWNGVSQADFETALKIVNSSLPEIPTMSIEAYTVVDQIMIPETLDWIGFDRYDSIDPANDSEWLADLETILTSRTRPDQRIVIVASTQWLPYYQTDAGISPSDMVNIINSYYQVSNSYSEVIALVGYLWPGGLDDPEQLGARNLPDDVQQRLQKIGYDIINK